MRDIIKNNKDIVSEIDGDGWLRILKTNPKVLKDNPQLDKKMIARKLGGFNWMELLSHYPEFIEFYCGSMKAYQWVTVLMLQPQLEEYCGNADEFSFDDLPSESLVELVQSDERFVKHCRNFKYFNNYNTVKLLMTNPEFVSYFVDNGILSNLSPCEWVRLLSRQPDIRFYYSDWHVDFSAYEDMMLLSNQPELEDVINRLYNGKEWHNNMRSEWWGYLIHRQPQFYIHCDMSRLTPRDFSIVYEDVFNHLRYNY